MADLGSADANVWTYIHNLEERYFSSLAALQWEFHLERQCWQAELHSIRMEGAELQSIRQLVPKTAPVAQERPTVPSTAPVAQDLPTAVSKTEAPGLAFIARSVCEEAMTKTSLGSGIASLLQEPLESRNIALAYSTVRQRLNGGQRSLWNRWLRNIKDLLVMRVCIGSGPWTNDSLRAAMEEAFDQPLDTDIMASFVQTFNMILRLSKDRDAFDRTTANQYGEALDAAAAKDLFETYVLCAMTSPGYISKTKQEKRPRHKGKKEKKNTGVDMLETALSLETALEEAAASGRIQHTLELALEEAAAAGAGLGGGSRSSSDVF